MSEQVEQASKAFDVYCQIRHQRKVEEDGGMIEILEEASPVQVLIALAELSNAARYAFINIYVANASQVPTPPSDSLGTSSFHPASKRHPHE